MVAMEAGALQGEIDNARNHLSMQAVQQIKEMLENPVASTPNPQLLESYAQTLHEQIDQYPIGDIHNILTQMLQIGQRLQTLGGQVRKWTRHFRPILQDLQSEQTIS